MRKLPLQKPAQHPLLPAAVAMLLLACMAGPRAQQPPAPVRPVPLNISQAPLMATQNATPNVLLIMDNSNSMDEAPNGSAVGSNSPASKSEIARAAARTIVERYQGRMNLGLMAYQQKDVDSTRLYNSLYDVSYDPNHFDPQWTGTRASPSHKRFRFPNPSDSGRFIYYNVALPFYYTKNLTHSHCFSETANAGPTPANPDGFHTTERAIVGLWDIYSCFGSKIGTANATSFANTGKAGYGNSPSWAEYVPTDSDYAQGIYDFGKQLFNTPIGRAWFSASLPGRGFLHQPIRPLDGTHRAELDRKLATSQFEVNGPTHPALPLQNAGNTPLEGTLLTALDYFRGENQWRNAGEGYVPACYPLPQSCGRNFVVLLTDGLPSTRPDGTIIEDMAAGLRQTAEAARRLREANVETFVIGFALPFGTNPEQLNQVAAAGGTGRAFAANDPATLDTALQAIFADIAARSSSVAAVAANSTNVTSSTRIYQARFDPRDWSGTLSAHSITGTAVAEQAQWEAGIPATRRILSYRPDTRKGVAFAWDALNPEQQGQIGSREVLAYLRGSQAQEAPHGPLRKRTSLLGDIVNSAPVYVGAPEMPYSEASYREFRKARANRRKMVYVGANDGMLHAFDAATGQELFAYVPSTVIPHLRQLSDPNYRHRFYVDGSPMVSDAFIGDRWRTILVGGLGAGGQGVYALDITDPDAITEAAAKDVVLWEFGDRDRRAPGSNRPAGFDMDMGFSFAQPSIARTRAGWMALFGNGYNNVEADGAASTSGNAVLYAVNLETGALHRKWDTRRGVQDSTRRWPNGLSTPAAVDLDDDGLVDRVYAGDLQGNMWRFDLMAASGDGDGIVPSVNGTPAPMTTPWGGSLHGQPITTRPEAKISHGTLQSHVQLLYGTGKSFEVGDHDAAAPASARQYFFSLLDEGAGGSSASHSVLKVTSVDAGAANGDGRTTPMSLRLISDGRSGNRNWIMPLADAGERLITHPMLRRDRIIFTTAVPSTQMCTAGGHSWLMELSLDGQGAEKYAEGLFDINGDGTVDGSDRYGDNDRATGGARLEGISSQPAILNNGKQETKVMNSTAGLQSLAESKGPLSNRRISWREDTPADIHPLGLD
ncbi:PilC/PilY family type IV pilus protein [Delftia tsuruhatensis]